MAQPSHCRSKGIGGKVGTEGSDSTSALTANKVGALFVFLGSSFLGVFVPYFIPVRQNILKFDVLFTTGLFIGMSLLYLMPETEELFADLTTNITSHLSTSLTGSSKQTDAVWSSISQYPLAYLVVVMGVFLTWLCDLIVKTESDPTVVAVLGVGQKAATEGDTEGGSGSTPADYNVLSFVDVALILFALCFHAVFEGLAVGLATTVYDVWQMASSIAVNEGRHVRQPSDDGDATRGTVVSVQLGCHQIRTRSKAGPSPKWLQDFKLPVEAALLFLCHQHGPAKQHDPVKQQQQQQQDGKSHEHEQQQEGKHEQQKKATNEDPASGGPSLIVSHPLPLIVLPSLRLFILSPTFHASSLPIVPV
ncbi:unnamed protein product [Closterium sp. NIES-65]|nr:unnamed protein product [Closterium sp. NIES-65]